MAEKIRNFRDLNVWQLGMEVVLKVYKVTRGFPQEERFGLMIQMRRAAVSIPSNISEGFNRYSNKEYRQFLFVALGSLAELETQVELAVRLGYIPKSACQDLIENLIIETKMLRNLIKKL